MFSSQIKQLELQLSIILEKQRITKNFLLMYKTLGWRVAVENHAVEIGGYIIELRDYGRALSDKLEALKEINQYKNTTTPRGFNCLLSNLKKFYNELSFEETAEELAALPAEHLTEFWSRVQQCIDKEQEQRLKTFQDITNKACPRYNEMVQHSDEIIPKLSQHVRKWIESNPQTILTSQIDKWLNNDSEKNNYLKLQKLVALDALLALHFKSREEPLTELEIEEERLFHKMLRQSSSFGKSQLLKGFERISTLSVNTQQKCKLSDLWMIGSVLLGIAIIAGAISIALLISLPSFIPAGGVIIFGLLLSSLFIAIPACMADEMQKQEEAYQERCNELLAEASTTQKEMKDYQDAHPDFHINKFSQFKKEVNSLKELPLCESDKSFFKTVKNDIKEDKSLTKEISESIKDYSILSMFARTQERINQKNSSDSSVCAAKI